MLSPEHADELRVVYEVHGHTVSMYQERAPWRGEGDWTREGIARFRFNRSRGRWQLYWMRSELRWHLYDPDEITTDLAVSANLNVAHLGPLRSPNS